MADTARGPVCVDKWLSERIETIKRQYFVVKAKVAANYKPEHHKAQADAYKNVLILLGVECEL